MVSKHRNHPSLDRSSSLPHRHPELSERPASFPPAAPDPSAGDHKQKGAARITRTAPQALSKLLDRRQHFFPYFLIDHNIFDGFRKRHR
jgi:hypothetical protein